MPDPWPPRSNRRPSTTSWSPRSTASIPQLSSSSPPPRREELAEIVGDARLRAVRRPRRRRHRGQPDAGHVPDPDGLKAWIEDVVVDAAAARQGVGEALNRAALDEARRRGAKDVDLTSRPSAEAANRLYQRIGFEPPRDQRLPLHAVGRGSLDGGRRPRRPGGPASRGRWRPLQRARPHRPGVSGSTNGARASTARRRIAGLVGGRGEDRIEAALVADRPERGDAASRTSGRRRPPASSTSGQHGVADPVSCSPHAHAATSTTVGSDRRARRERSTPGCRAASVGARRRTTGSGRRSGDQHALVVEAAEALEGAERGGAHGRIVVAAVRPRRPTSPVCPARATVRSGARPALTASAGR